MSDKSTQIQELTKRNDELENYFRNTIIPQLFVDADLTLQKFTPPAMKHFKLSDSDVGKSIVDVKDNFRFATIVDLIQKVISSNEILEKEIQTTDLRWYQMNIIPYVARENNKTNGVIITFIEITMRIKDLKEQEKLISDHETLLDTISHDIKNPITNLMLTINLFKEIPPNDEKQIKALVKILENAITKMKDVILELTDTRKDEYKYKAVEELLNFENIVEDVRLTLTDAIEESKAIITSEINVSEITFARRKLRSIIYNLVSNAIKFRSAAQAPKIHIKTECQDSFIIISVTDNGIGIDLNKHDTIFSKYFRLENNIEGSGIGLYLVKEIVNNSGGRIELESAPGKGSTFKIYLKSA